MCVCVLSDIESRDLDNMPYFSSLFFINPLNSHITETNLTETQEAVREASPPS